QVPPEPHGRPSALRPGRLEAALEVVVRGPAGRVRLPVVEHRACDLPAILDGIVGPRVGFEDPAHDVAAHQELLEPLALPLRLVRPVPPGVLPGAQAGAGDAFSPPVVAVVAPEVGRGAVASGPGAPDRPLPRLAAGLAVD